MNYVSFGLAIVFYFGVFGLSFLPEAAVSASAYEILENSSPPIFKKDHTLLPLSRWGWSLDFETAVKLTENWGYALEFGERATKDAAKATLDVESHQGRVCALSKSDPLSYPVAVILSRSLATLEKTGELPETYWLQDSEGKRVEGPAWKTKSPEAPDEIHERVAEEMLEPLLMIKKNCSVSIILHGGESGLPELGHSLRYLKKDPAVVTSRGERTWWDYYSEQKARWMMPITRSIRDAFPERKALIWYHFGGMPGWSAQQWTWNYDYMREVADYPGQSLYYKHFNTGWTGKKDLLSNFLASYAQAETYGDTLSYNWLCAGWKEGKYSEINRYMGFLKSLYMAGQIGGVAGYFSYPDNGFRGDVGESPPHWLRQIMVLGRVHALFSHLEEFIRDGELLAGPGDNALVKKRTGENLPAYVFPTGDPDVRVLVRRHIGKDEWLASAWAASGDARETTVFIDELGEITLLARPGGSVYRITARFDTPYEPPELQKELIDLDEMLPSQGFK